MDEGGERNYAFILFRGCGRAKRNELLCGVGISPARRTKEILKACFEFARPVLRIALLQNRAKQPVGPHIPSGVFEVPFTYIILARSDERFTSQPDMLTQYERWRDTLKPAL